MRKLRLLVLFLIGLCLLMTPCAVARHWTPVLGPELVSSPFALEAELVTNGDMELNSVWITHGGATLTEQSVDQALSPTHSWKVVSAGEYDGIRWSTTPDLAANTMYRIASSIYGDGAIKLAVKLAESGLFVAHSPLSVNEGGYVFPASWTSEEWFHCTTDAVPTVAFYAFTGVGQGVGTFYLDDVSLRPLSFWNSISDDTGFSITENTKISWDGSQTGAVTLTKSGLFVVGGIYKIEYTVANRSAGTVKVQVGTTNGTSRNADGTYVEYITCAGDTAFDIVADADFAGEITTNLSIRGYSIRRR